MINVTRILAAPGYIGTQSQSILTKGIITVDLVQDTQVVMDALTGEMDEVIVNQYAKLVFTPKYRDATNTDAIFFPWISTLATPPGTIMLSNAGSLTTSAVPWVVYGADGTVLTLVNGTVTKMPGINLGANLDVFDTVEVTGIPSPGADLTSTALFTLATGQSFTYPAIPGTSYLLRCKWTGAWGAVAGYTSMEAFDGVKITHDLKMTWKEDNGQWVVPLFKSYRAMCSVRTTAATMAQSIAAQGWGSSAQGKRLSAINQSDLVWSGVGNGSPVITLKNASKKRMLFNFDGSELRQGAESFITGDPGNSGAPVASLVLA